VRKETILNSEQTKIINQMIGVVYSMHQGQIRKGSGIPYVFHVMDVTKRVTNLGVYDLVTILGSLGHDLFEDTEVKEGYLKQLFGGEVVKIIRECTREGGDAVTRKEKIEFLATFKKKSFNSCIIKLCDRMSNTWDYYYDGQVAYAKLYAFQAYPLYWHLRDNEENLKLLFGDKVTGNILDCVEEMEDFIFQGPSPFVGMEGAYFNRNESVLQDAICNRSVKTTFDSKEK
jgi:hypothetical protein